MLLLLAWDMNPFLARRDMKDGNYGEVELTSFELACPIKIR